MRDIFYPHRPRCVAAQQHAAPSIFTARFIIWCVALAAVASCAATVF